jgi:hypothetical protein
MASLTPATASAAEQASRPSMAVSRGRERQCHVGVERGAKLMGEPRYKEKAPELQPDGDETGLFMA